MWKLLCSFNLKPISQHGAKNVFWSILKGFTAKTGKLNITKQTADFGAKLNKNRSKIFFFMFSSTKGIKFYETWYFHMFWELLLSSKLSSEMKNSE